MSVTSDEILRTLGPRQTIARAVAVLMARYELSEEAALEVLVIDAGESHTKIREMASRVIAEQRRPA